VVLRPDRYVAALCDARNLSGALVALRSRLSVRKLMDTETSRSEAGEAQRYLDAMVAAAATCSTTTR
jgi:hypothetical protein